MKNGKSAYSLSPSDRTKESIDRAERKSAAIARQPRTNGSADTATHQLSSAQMNQSKKLKLTPEGSNAAAREKEVAESWRSCLLHYETDLRELVADGVNAPPTSTRIMKVISLYDGVIRVAETQSEHLAEFLRLFRVEFCRAMFSHHDIGLGEDDSGQLSTYFDQVNSLMRENALLSTEVALGNTKERVAELTAEVEQLTETINVYKNEIDRLTRQKDQALDQCRKSREAVENIQGQLEAQTTKTERELQALNVENKDMQLQLFRLRKQVAGGRAKLLKDTYTQLKLSKMSMMTTLFSEGDERIGLLVLMSQLESRLNEILDTYDNEFILSSEILHPEIRRKMGSGVAVILEEMHLCEQNYRRLVPRTTEAVLSEDIDETDCFVALLFDPKIYEKLLNREAIRRRLELHTTDGDVLTGRPSEDGKRGIIDVLPDAAKFPDPPKTPDTSADGTRRYSMRSQTERRDTDHGKSLLGDEDCSLEEIVFKKKAEWVETIFSTASTHMILTKYGLKVSVERQPEGTIPVDMLMPRLLRHPLKELSSKKFLRGVEVFSGSNPAQQKFLCAVNYIDPSTPIQLPELTNFIKLKYKNSLKVEEVESLEPKQSIRPFSSSIKMGDDVSPKRVRSGDGKSRPTSGSTNLGAKQVNDWGGRTVYREERKDGQNDDLGSRVIFSENENLKVFRELNNPLLFQSHNSKQQRTGAMSSTTATTVAFQRLNPLAPNRAPEWTLYKGLFGGYRSFTPRMLEITTIDHIMLCTCERHFTRLECRFEQCLNEANLRATTNQMSLSMAERFFRESNELTDFQEALVDELESRYVYPELVAKNLYELLCYLDAMAGKDNLMSLYLNVVRGFEPPTNIHYTCFLLYHLSYSWPSSSPQEEVSRDDALTVLRFLYRNTDAVVRVDINDTLRDFDMATRSASLTLGAMRTFLASASQHQEEPMLLFLNGAFARSAEASSGGETSFDSYAAVITKNWEGNFDEKRNLVRFLSAGLSFNNKGPLLSTKDLAFVAASIGEPMTKQPALLVLPWLHSSTWERTASILSHHAAAYATETENHLRLCTSLMIKIVHGNAPKRSKTKIWNKEKFSCPLLTEAILSLGDEDTNYFVENVMPWMVHLLLTAPDTFQKDVPLLLSGENGELQLTSRETVILLTCSFFSLFPFPSVCDSFTYKGSEGREFPNPNMCFLHSSPCYRGQESQLAKARAILLYFIAKRREEESAVSQTQQFDTRHPPVLILSRKNIAAASFPTFETSQKPLVNVDLNDVYIEDHHDALQAIFANKIIGGGVFGHGCVQEEIRLMVSPELLVAVMVCEKLHDNDALFCNGGRLFVSYRGYASTFRVDPLESSVSSTPCSVVWLDALPFGRCGSQRQWKKECIERETRKAYVAFGGWRDFPDDAPIATGNWGCGAFGGDPILKFLIQWCAASEAQRPMKYSLFDSHPEKYESLIRQLGGRTVGDVYREIIENFNGILDSEPSRGEPNRLDAVAGGETETNSWCDCLRDF